MHPYQGPDVSNDDCASVQQLCNLSVFCDLVYAKQSTLLQAPLMPLALKSAGEDVFCLLLVASRDIKDEELLLNYRLSPGAATPDWYVPIDPVEAKRRWA